MTCPGLILDLASSAHGKMRLEMFPTIRGGGEDLDRNLAS